jgi:hypothetical protein
MRLGEYVLMTAPAPGVQMTWDYTAMSVQRSFISRDSLTMSQPSLALAMAEKYGAPV